MRKVNAIINNGIPEVNVEDTNNNLGQVRLIDVRRPDEFNNELGHIHGAELVTLGEDLTEFLKKQKNKDQEIIFVCRSGKRSETATLEAQQLGYKFVANMVGGMLLWNEKQFKVERE